MKKTVLFILVIFVFNSIVTAQKITPSDLKLLTKKEDSLKALAKNLIVDSLTAGRMRNDSFFVRTLIRGLQVKNSFYYPFDSVQGISNVYAPDSTFRIFSWSLSFDDYYSRQRGAIQFRTPDGSLRLVPLRDFSEFTSDPTDSVRTKDTWIGAVYYKIIKTQFNQKNYYTLFGFDNNSVRSNKKWIEVMTINEKNQPVFGGPYFTFEKDSVKRPVQYRYSIEYKKEASTFVNYDEDLKLILVDHLISETDEPDKPYTFIPDGDYEGFEWKGGKWTHIDKVFHQKLEDGQAPVPKPILEKEPLQPQQKP
ncbi:hypothetical protein OCK74_07985 [Chitinophagaceae bacterium LB-8]|uniref:Uncharacterized protein n=1 Tax=Paraflavisolibacter caeni TaxID=2982496 RepID=A0A9X3BH71_9BACT|nr:hypothetical protein [Paraflavisolibacter caeni]MCU7549052.1 hypothetical protein [Paraflavisolibacter caeni]